MNLPEYVSEFMSAFTSHGFQIFVVGGAVRNLFLGKENTNWDFTTNARPEQILNLFPHSFYHNQYGTVTVQYGPNKEHLFEITPFRKEGTYSDGRHPDSIVWAKTVEEDLQRRDFTINAMAYDGKTLVDLFNGKKDLDERRITAVGDPDKRFEEDALRLMRAVRFAAQLGFFIDDATRSSIQRNAEKIKQVSWERIRDEFLKILASDHPSEGVLFLKNLNLLQYLLPEVDICFLIPQKSPKRHHIYDVGTHLVMALKHCPSSDPITRFATLLHDIGKAQTFRRDDETGLITFYNHEVVGAQLTMQIADRFRLSAKDKEKLVTLVAQHQFTVSELQTDKAVKRFIREVGKENIQSMLDLRTGDRIGSGATPTSWRLELFKKRIEEVQHEPFQIKDLKVTGHDVMEQLHLTPGPQIGEILTQLFEKVEDKQLPNERDVLLSEIIKYGRSKTEQSQTDA